MFLCAVSAQSELVERNVKAQEITDQLQESLQLDNYQMGKLTELNIKYLQYFDDVMTREMPEERREANRTAMQKRLEHELKQLLTESQYAVFEEGVNVKELYQQ